MIKETAKNYLERLGSIEQVKTIQLLNARIKEIKEFKSDNEPYLTKEERDLLNNHLMDLKIKETAIKKQEEINKIESDLFLDEESKKRLLKVLGAMYKTEEKNNELTTIEKEDLQRKNREDTPKINVKDEVNLQLKNSTKTEERGEEFNELMKGIYISGIHPKPKYKAPLITFKGQIFLTGQNLSMIIAEAGMGKSSICESILASMHNPECDSLGFKIGDEVKTALFFDCERDFLLVDKSNERMWRRIGEVKEEGKQTIIVGMREQFTTANKKDKIIKLVQYYKPQLLIIDGIADLMKSPNSEEETTEIYTWLITLITNYKLSILSTIHPNSGGLKARGHLGSEMIRRCESIVRVTENIDRTIKTISTTKERQGEPCKHSFTWDKNQGNNVTCLGVTTGAIKRPPLLDSITKEEVWKLKESFTTGEKGKEEGGKFIGEYTMDRFKEIEQKLQLYIKENHPELNGGTNAIGNLIKDLVNRGHLLKIGISPNTKYTFASNSRDKILNYLFKGTLTEEKDRKSETIKKG